MSPCGWQSTAERAKRCIRLAVATSEAGATRVALRFTYEAKVLLARILADDAWAFGRPSRLGAWADECLSRLVTWEQTLINEEDLCRLP